MFEIDSDKTIYITRGDAAYFTVTMESHGEKRKFQPGEVVRMKVTAKKDCNNVAFQKDFPVLEETDKVDIFLTEDETKIGDTISKPVIYWYEIELNPYTNPQTIIGYDEDGAKIFKLFPEGRDLGNPTTPKDVPVVDAELDFASERPVQNQAVTRAIYELMKQNGQGGSPSRVSHIDLFSDKWEGSGSLYSQVVAIGGVTEYSKIDINPSIEQLAIFHSKDIAFVAENEDGVVTVFCIGQKPTTDYTMQITITEVFVNG